MSKGMLGSLKLSEVQKVCNDLETRLAGPDGETWFTALKRMLRKEPSWPEVPFWRAVNETTIEVNLDAPPVLPFPDATVEWIKPGQTGWVRVERKGDKLFVDGNEVLLHLDAGQKKGGSIQGHDLRKQLEGKAVLHPNIADSLLENVHLIPDNWKQDKAGNTIYVYFWAVGYRYSDGRLYVRCVYFDDGQWHRDFIWLGYHWVGRNPAAVSAS